MTVFLYLCYMKSIIENINNYFNDVSFEEATHKYKVNNNELTHSVSDIIKQYSKPFDANKISVFTAKKRQVEKQIILDEWEQLKNESIKIGKSAHKFAEDYFNNKNIKPVTGYDKAIIKFWNEVPEHIIPLYSELKIFHKEKLFGGTPDNLWYNTATGMIIITDYKTNKDLFKNYKGQKLLQPFTNLLDNPYNKYQIQLSLYQILIEQVPIIKVASRKIVYLTNEGQYILYNTDDYTDILKNELKQVV